MNINKPTARPDAGRSRSALQPRFSPVPFGDPPIEAGAGAIDQFGRGQSDRAATLRDQPVGRTTMQVHGSEQRRLRRPVLRQQCHDQTGEHVAAAGRRQSRIAACIDKPVAVGRGNDRAAPLERDVRVVGRRQFERRARPVGLDLCNAAIEQTRSLGRVRRQQGREFPGRERNMQIALAGDQIQRIGIEDQRQPEVDDAVEDDAGLVACSHAGAAGQCGELGRQQFARRAHHQFRLLNIERRCVLVEQSDIDATAAQAQCRTGRKQRCADHAACAAENAGVAEAALVAVRQARTQKLREKIGGNGASCIFLDGAGADVERRQRDFAAVIRPVGC